MVPLESDVLRPYKGGMFPIEWGRVAGSNGVASRELKELKVPTSRVVVVGLSDREPEHCPRLVRALSPEISEV